MALPQQMGVPGGAPQQPAPQQPMQQPAPQMPRMTPAQYNAFVNRVRAIEAQQNRGQQLDPFTARSVEDAMGPDGVVEMYGLDPQAFLDIASTPFPDDALAANQGNQLSPQAQQQLDIEMGPEGPMEMYDLDPEAYREIGNMGSPSFQRELDAFVEQAKKKRNSAVADPSGYGGSQQP